MVRAFAVIAAVASAILVAPAGATHAREPSAISAATEAQPVTSPRGMSSAGYAPQWVQYPYLSGDNKGKLTVVAKLFVDPKRTRARKYVRQDRLTMRVAVGKKKYSRVAKPRSIEVLPDNALLMRAHQTRKVARSGVMTIKVPLSKKVSEKLRDRGFQGRRAAVAVSVSHRKDTKKGGSEHELTQISIGHLIKGKVSARRLQQATVAAVDQRRALRRSASREAVRASSEIPKGETKDTPYFNNIYVQNNSPFQQQVTFQPVIQCMWAAYYAYSAPPPAALSTVNAGDTVSFDVALPAGFEYFTNSPKSWQPGLAGVEKGLNAPGTQGTLTSDLVNSANAAGQEALGAVVSPRTYSTAGAVGAVAATSVKFLLSFFEGLKVDTCNNTSQYPQLFGVSSAVVGFGTNGVTDPLQATWPATNTWAGSPAAGNQGSVTDAPDNAFITGTLAQALGAQTSSVYYWNGGAPAAMVSPDASSGAYTGGSATFQDGLIQYVGPSPGSPRGVASCDSSGDGACKYTTLGDLHIQLSYLTNPLYSAGLLSEGAAPVMTAGVDSTGTYTLNCDLSQMAATLTTPFGVGAPTTVEQSTLTTTPTNGAGQLPQNADWLVNFFGVSANGQPVYIEESVTTTANSVTTPYLAPNAANQPVSIQAASAGGSQAVALGTVTPGDLENMVTLDGSPAEPTQFGCTAAPTVSLPGLAVNTGNTNPIAMAYGNNWPVPTQSGKGWPEGFYGNNKAPFDFKWQKPVGQMNVTFQGPPLSALTTVP